MQRRTFFTTFEISQICGVNPTTVQNWVKGKKLKAFQTPGGHRRVRREDLLSFLIKFDMPIPDELKPLPPLILIVDDETDVLDMLEEIVKSGDENVSVARAASGIEALLMIGERKPDLLVLDVKMPGMDGYEVCQKLKSGPGTRKIKIIAISGDHGAAVKKHILNSGADLFFTKPLEVGEFRKQCFRLLRS